MQQFTALEDFWCEETRSQYCAGLTYTAREEDLALLAALPTWEAGGKVRLGGSAATVEGRE